MQQIQLDENPIIWYFAFGAPQKTSLSKQFCRQNKFQYFNNPSQHELINCQTNAIIEGSLQLFHLLEKHNPHLCIIYFGQDYSNEQLNKIRKQYQSIGKCKDVIKLDHTSCRKALYPNLIFVYGPIQKQNQSVGKALASNISYTYFLLPHDPNYFIEKADKTCNYVINGLFTSFQQISTLDKYFTIRIIHFKYSRDDIPQFSLFFDSEQDLLPHLKTKSYYLEIHGDTEPIKINEEIGIGLCPKLIFINEENNTENQKFVEDYLKVTDGLLLNITSIENIRNCKGLPPLAHEQDKIQTITQIIYKDLTKKEILFTGYPKQTYEFVQFQNMNRKFSYFIDLTTRQQYQYTQQFSNQIYFLEEQSRIAPQFDLTLKEQLQSHIVYWVINGPGTCGKTSLAKYISAEFGYKLIQFEIQAATAKEKVGTPEDGDEMPIKKYVDYFANLIKSNLQVTYIFDCLPYSNTDLQLWIKEIGCPSVINLRVQTNELIKRMRQKAESDLTAEVSQEQTTKINENIQKNNEWIEKLQEYGPSSIIYQVDNSQPQILTQHYINSILKPRIFLVQKNNHLLYQNIALKYNMGFVNLRTVPLLKCISLVKKCKKRDIILCNYGYFQSKHTQNQLHLQKLVSEDLYWIQKNLGQIRYLGIWQPEETEIAQKKMQLEKPPEPIKSKPAEGEEQQQQQAAEEDEQGKPKKVFNIYQYEWTEHETHKNLSQWFMKLKKNIIKRNNDRKSCFFKFQQVLSTLNQDKDVHFYEIIGQPIS